MPYGIRIEAYEVDEKDVTLTSTKEEHFEVFKSAGEAERMYRLMEAFLIVLAKLSKPVEVRKDGENQSTT